MTDVALAGNSQMSARAGSDTLRFDYLIAATGYRIDLAAQPELARIQEQVALWGDRYERPGEEDAGAGAHPYLGAGFEFLPRLRIRRPISELSSSERLQAQRLRFTGQPEGWPVQ